MSGAVHTPGPWVADGFQDCQLITKDVPVAIGRPIGIGKIYSPNMVADARLIAAAPALLEALHTAQGNIMNVIVGLGSGDSKAKAIADLQAALDRLKEVTGS